MFPARTIPARRPGSVLVSLLPILLGAGVCSCSTESGILVSVTGSEVDSLEFYVGVLHEGSYLLEPSVSGQRFDVRGRNLNSSPYELFLHEQDEAGDPSTLRVLAVGRQGEEIYGYDITEPPQTFIRGELLRRSLQLRRTDWNTSIQRRGTSCWRMEDGEESWLIFTAADMDCDGSTTADDPPDCNDADDAVYPGASEVCDGKENNCDGQFAADSQVCYARVKEADVCRAGTRICRDAKGQGLDPTCAVTGEGKQVPEAFCMGYAQCEGAAPLTCMEHHIDRRTLSCTLNTDKNEDLCLPTVTLEPPVASDKRTEKCGWMIFEMAGIKASFAEGTQVNSSASCEPLLFLKRADGGAESGSITVEFLYEVQGDAGLEQRSVLLQAEVDLSPADEKGCPSTFSCK